MNREDPMFGLLSSVGGINSSRFQKPQAMKDQRGGQTSPVDKNSTVSQAQKPSRDYGSLGAQNSGKYSSSVERDPSKFSGHSQTASKSTSKGDANSQLDSLLEGDLFKKRSRYVIAKYQNSITTDWR